MRSWWSPLARRLEVVKDVHRRGEMALFVESFAVALVTPLLLRLPPERLDMLVAWCTPARAGRARPDPEAIATTVLQMLKAGRPLVRRGCLTRGLTLYYFLRRAGVDAELVFGMGRASGGDGFDGHCWIAIDGEPYLEPSDPRLVCAKMYSFPGRAVSHERVA